MNDGFVIKTDIDGFDFREVTDLLSGFGLSDLDNDKQRLVYP